MKGTENKELSGAKSVFSNASLTAEIAAILSNNIGRDPMWDLSWDKPLWDIVLLCVFERGYQASDDHHVWFLRRLMSRNKLLGVSACFLRLKSISSSPSSIRSSNSACGRSNWSSDMSMTVVGLLIAASGNCSNPFGVIGPACGAVLRF